MLPLDLSRRSFFSGLGASLIAAPAIVRAASLMPVKALVLPTEGEMRVFLDARLIAEGGKFTKIRFTSGGSGYEDMPFVVFDPIAEFHRMRQARLRWTA